MLGPTPDLSITIVGGSTRRRKGTAMVLDAPAPLHQVDGVVEPTSNPTSNSTYNSTCTSNLTCISTCTPTSTTTPPGTSLRGAPFPEWPPPPGTCTIHPDYSDPTVTCTLCGANPQSLTFDIEWPRGGLCPYCRYTMLNPPC